MYFVIIFHFFFCVFLIKDYMGSNDEINRYVLLGFACEKLNKSRKINYSETFLVWDTVWGLTSHCLKEASGPEGLTDATWKAWSMTLRLPTSVKFLVWGWDVSHRAVHQETTWCLMRTWAVSHISSGVWTEGKRVVTSYSEIRHTRWNVYTTRWPS